MSQVITLQYPVEIRNRDTQAVIERIECLELRRPTARDLQTMDTAKGEVGKTIALLARLAGKAPSTIELLDATDFAAASGVIEEMMGKSQPTGAT